MMQEYRFYSRTSVCVCVCVCVCACYYIPQPPITTPSYPQLPHPTLPLFIPTHYLIQPSLHPSPPHPSFSPPPHHRHPIPLSAIITHQLTHPPSPHLHPPYHQHTAPHQAPFLGHPPSNLHPSILLCT